MTGLCSAETGTWSGPVWLTSAGSGPSWSSSASRWSCSARSQFSSQGRRRQHPEEQPPSPSWEVLSGRRESESESTRPSRSKFSRLIKIIHLKLFLIPYILHVLESWLGLSKRLWKNFCFVWCNVSILWYLWSCSAMLTSFSSLFTSCSDNSSSCSFYNNKTRLDIVRIDRDWDIRSDQLFGGHQDPVTEATITAKNQAFIQSFVFYIIIYILYIFC